MRAICGTVACAGWLLLAGAGVGAQTPEEIVTRSEDLMKGSSSQGSFRMTITTPDYTRTMQMDTWWVGNEKALIVVTAPQREAGNKTLKVNNELWMYLRTTETTIKVPPSMMLQSWNGSDFTNDDLVRESNLVRDYAISVAGEEQVDGEGTWELHLLPRPTAPVVWGKIIHWIRKSDYLPATTAYYDEQGILMRTMVYSRVTKFGDRRIPASWVMINNRKPGHSTEFQILAARFNVKLPEGLFSFQELEKGRIR